MDDTTLNALKAFAYQPPSAPNQPKVLLKLQGRTLVAISDADMGFKDRFFKFLSLFGIGRFSLSAIVNHINTLDTPNSTLDLAKIKLLQKVERHNNKSFVFNVRASALQTSVNAIAQRVLGILNPPNIEDAFKSANTFDKLDALEIRLILSKSLDPASEKRLKELRIDLAMSELIALLESTYHVSNLSEVKVIETQLETLANTIPLTNDSTISNQIQLIKAALEQRKEALKTGVAPSEPMTTFDPIAGGGIVNGGNSCYLNAVVQALRFVPFEDRYFGEENVQGARGWLQALHAKLQNTSLTADDINDFRNFLRVSCNLNADEYSQEDAHDAIMCILDALSVDVFDVSAFNSEENKNRIAAHTVLSIPILNAVKDKSISSLMQAEGIAFVQAPTTLPIHLERYIFENKSINKNNTNVRLEQRLTVSLTDGTTREYELASVVIHKGETPQRGHYYSYALQENSDWVQFDDSQVRRSSGAHDETLQDIQSNGYMFMYRLLPANA